MTDDPATPRPITHSLEFPSVEAGDVFLEAAALRRYRCTSHPGAGDLDRPAEGPYRFEVTRDDPAEQEHLERVVRDLAELAAPYDGDHVAWREA